MKKLCDFKRVPEEHFFMVTTLSSTVVNEN